MQFSHAILTQKKQKHLLSRKTILTNLFNLTKKSVITCMYEDKMSPQIAFNSVKKIQPRISGIFAILYILEMV